MSTSQQAAAAFAAAIDAADQTNADAIAALAVRVAALEAKGAPVLAPPAPALPLSIDPIVPSSTAIQIVTGAYTGLVNVLVYSLDGGAVVNASSAPIIKNGVWSFTVPTPAAGTHKIEVFSDQNTTATASFTVAGSVTAAGSGGSSGTSSAVTSGGTSSVPATPLPATLAYTVGPGGQFAHMSDLGPSLIQYWRDSNGNPLASPRPMDITFLYSDDPTYWVGDYDVQSARWVGTPTAGGWPAWSSSMEGPVAMRGQAGKPPPDFAMTGPATMPGGGYYPPKYQTGAFNFVGGHDVTVTNMKFSHHRRNDGFGNYRALNISDVDIQGNVVSSGNFLFSDIIIDDCDTGFLGGVAGMTLHFLRCDIRGCGNGDGKTHNCYGGGSVLIWEDCISTDAKVGHLFKTRAAAVTFRGTNRLIGNLGSESYCLDQSDGGVLLIEAGATLVLARGASPANGAHIHYGGENHDAVGIPFAVPASIAIDGTLICVGNAAGTWTTSDGQVYPLALMSNWSGAGTAVSGAASFLVKPTLGAAGVIQAWGLQAASYWQEIAAPVSPSTQVTASNVDYLPVTALSAAPALDLSSPATP